MPLNFKLENAPSWRVSETEIRHCHRAKYSITAGGEPRLMSIQSFSKPMFLESGYELCDGTKKSNFFDTCGTTPSEEDRRQNLLRSSRRAKVSAFDLIECNPDLDTFATMTISPQAANRESWEDCYGLMRVWLSNRVQRRGLKYVCVPEYHKDGKSIHFHALFNSEALRMERARNPSGRLIYQKKRPVFNLTDVDFGFTTAIPVTGENSRDKVSKYIFKYMGKQYDKGCIKIGGRYFLHGGNLLKPYYVYSDDLEELLPGTPELYKKSVDITNNLTYEERYFI